MEMKLQEISGLSDYALSEVAIPNGWMSVDLFNYTKNTINLNAIDTKNTINLNANLSFVTERVDEFINALHQKLEIDILDCYMAIDADVAFHVILLVEHDTYLSPKMLASRILAQEYLNSTDTVGIRYTFTINDEYLKAHVNTNSFKLNEHEFHLFRKAR